MVSSISAHTAVNNKVVTAQTDDVTRLIRYINNQPIKDTPDTFASTTKSALTSAAIFEGIPLLRFLTKGKKVKNLVTSSGTQINIKDAMKAMDERTASSLRNVFKGKDGTFFSRLSEYLKTLTENKKSFYGLKDATKAASKAEKAVAKGTNPDKIANAIKTAAGKADDFIKPSVIQSGAKQAGKLGKLKGILKSSGAGFMLIFSGVAEALTEVIPTFKELGFKKGIKQLFKSAFKVVADTAGFIGGEYAGTAIGGAIGTAICPGIGTAVGSVCGFLGGMLGSFITGKITKKIIGKSEREIAAEQQQQQQAQLIQTDTASLEELKQLAILKIQESASTGKLSKDDQAALEILQNMEATNPFMAAA